MKYKNRFSLVDFGVLGGNTLLNPWVEVKKGRGGSIYDLNLFSFSFPSIYPSTRVNKPLKTGFSGGLLDMNLNPWDEFANLNATMSKSARVRRGFNSAFDFGFNGIDNLAFGGLSNFSFRISPMRELGIYAPRARYLTPIYYSESIPSGLTENVSPKGDLKELGEMADKVDEWVKKRKARRETAELKLWQLEDESPDLYKGVPEKEIPKVRKKVLKTLIKQIKERENEPVSVKRIRGMGNVTTEDRYRVKDVVTKEQTKKREGLKERISGLFRRNKNKEKGINTKAEAEIEENRE